LEIKLTKWWKDTPKHFSKKEKLWQQIIWLGTYLRINLFSIKKENKEFKIACCLGNLSYRKLRHRKNENN